jgi:hypothetical protein
VRERDDDILENEEDRQTRREERLSATDTYACNEQCRTHTSDK